MIALMLLGACGDFGLAPLAGDVSGLLTTNPEREIRFDATIPSDRSIVQEVEIQSAGDGPVFVANLWVETNTEGVFYTGDDLPFPKTIDAGSAVSVNVRFLPTAVGSFHGALVIEVGNEGTIIERSLFGQGCRDDDDDHECD